MFLSSELWHHRVAVGDDERPIHWASTGMRTILASTLGVVLLNLGCAVASRHDQVVDYLALCSASQTGDELLVEALLERGTPVNALDADAAGELSYIAVHKDTPLQVAAENGHTRIVQLLISRGAWLDAQCCDNHTPVGRAARNGHAEIVRMLLEAGADASRPGEGSTPLDLARKAGHDTIVQMLEAAAGTRQ